MKHSAMRKKLTDAMKSEGINDFIDGNMMAAPRVEDIEAGKVSMKQFKAGQGGTSWLAIPGTYDGGDFSFRKKVRHPGMEARGFMAAGFSAIGPTVENDLSEANEKIIADLAAI
jgi:hypothetical protein